MTELHPPQEPWITHGFRPTPPTSRACAVARGRWHRQRVVPNPASHVVVLSDRDASLAELVRDLPCGVPSGIERCGGGLPEGMRREPSQRILTACMPDVAAYVRRVAEATDAVGEHRAVELCARHDPLSINRHSRDSGPQAVTAIYEALVAAELEAVTTAAPTPGAVDVIEAVHESRRRLAVVSNNAADAVARYLRTRELLNRVDHIAARGRSRRAKLIRPSTDAVTPAACKQRRPGVFDDHHTRRRGWCVVLDYCLSSAAGRFATLASSSLRWMIRATS